MTAHRSLVTPALRETPDRLAVSDRHTGTRGAARGAALKTVVLGRSAVSAPSHPPLGPAPPARPAALLAAPGGSVRQAGWPASEAFGDGEIETVPRGPRANKKRVKMPGNENIPSSRWTWFAAGILTLAGAGAVLAVSRPDSAAHRPVPAQAVLEFAPGDMFTAETRELTLSVPITGTLKPFAEAVVKAKAAGELQSLAVREGEAVRKGQVIGRIDSTEAEARVA